MEVKKYSSKLCRTLRDSFAELCEPDCIAALRIKSSFLYSPQTCPILSVFSFSPLYNKKETLYESLC